MSKRKCSLNLVLIFYLVFLISNLWSGSGSGDVDYFDEFPRADRIRNVPAVSSVITGISNDIFISSFGLRPDSLIGIDAWIFRGQIQNGQDQWNFVNTNYFFFDGVFETENNNLPGCGRNAYNEADYNNMHEGYYSLEETNARINGGTGFWTSPVLIEDQPPFLIILNKSGVLMCINTNLVVEDCVNWAFDLRATERSLNAASCKFEFMATPTVVGDNIFIPGIYHLFKIDFSDFENPSLDCIPLIDNFESDDHLINPITYDLEEGLNTNFLCISKNGDFTIVNSDLEIQTVFVIPEVEILSRPLTDSDGQVYIAANNGIIYYLPQLLTSNVTTLPQNYTDLSIIDCYDHNFRTSLITDGSRHIYALTDENDILKLKEEYDFTNDNPISYSWDSDYIYKDNYHNFKAINNHSVLLEKPELDFSCLTSIYNDDVIYNEEEYYNDAYPSSNKVFVRLIAIDYFTDQNDYISFHEPIDNSSTYGGLAPYKTSQNKNNLIWCDENGYAWSWRSHMPSHLVYFPSDATSPLIPSKSNPKFMKDLTNQPVYNKTDITVNIYGLETVDAEKIFLNSYSRDAVYYSLENYYSATFTDILKHKNYTLGICLSEGDPIVIEKININNQSVLDIFFETLTITEADSIIIDNQSVVYQDIVIEPGGILTIVNNSYIRVLGDIYLYNRGYIKIYNNSVLSITNSLINDQFDIEVENAIIETDNTFNDNGFLDVDTILVEEDGNLLMKGSGNYEYQIGNSIIYGICTLSPVSYQSYNSFIYYELVDIYGILNIEDITNFHNGSILNINNDQATLNLIETNLVLNESQFNILSGAECNLGVGGYSNSELYLYNSIITIDNQETLGVSSKMNVNDCSIFLDNSDISVKGGAELNLNGGSIIQIAVLNLKNRSCVNVDGSDLLGTPSRLFINWGSFIYGSVSTSYDPDPIPGDRIECTNGGLVKTCEDWEYHDYVLLHGMEPPIITISSSTEALWDGILITDPTYTEDYWFVNCDISGINKLAFEGNANEMANLKLYNTDFHDSGQILVRDGHKLTIKGASGNFCHIHNNIVYPICVYYSSVNFDSVKVGGHEDYFNVGGIYLYGMATEESIIEKSIFSHNNGEGVKLNGPIITFRYNDILVNSGFGMICYKPTAFVGLKPYSNHFTNNGFAEYAGMTSTFNLEDAFNYFTETNFEPGSNLYYLMNLDWREGDDPVPIWNNYFNDVLDNAPLENLFPDDSLAWDGEARTKQERILLEEAINDISNKDYISAEQILEQLISDYPLSIEAATAVNYLFHIVALTDQNYGDFINYLENLSISDSTNLYKAKENIITKTYIKSEDYITAITRLEEIINNSEIIDEIILAMIDEGYCYMKIAENGDRNLPVQCTIKTETIDEYQEMVSKLEKGFTFYPKNDAAPVINKVVLNPNYPNPFNPTTTISFSIPEDESVKIAIYNIKGQKVKEILDGKFEKGVHSVIWDGTNSNNKLVSSGIYFYKLDTSNEVAIKKMLLLK